MEVTSMRLIASVLPREGVVCHSVTPGKQLLPWKLSESCFMQLPWKLFRDFREESYVISRHFHGNLVEAYTIIYLSYPLPRGVHGIPSDSMEVAVASMEAATASIKARDTSMESPVASMEAILRFHGRSAI